MRIEISKRKKKKRFPLPTISTQTWRRGKKIVHQTKPKLLESPVHALVLFLLNVACTGVHKLNMACTGVHKFSAKCINHRPIKRSAAEASSGTGTLIPFFGVWGKKITRVEAIWPGEQKRKPVKQYGLEEKKKTLNKKYGHGTFNLWVLQTVTILTYEEQTATSQRSKIVTAQ